MFKVIFYTFMFLFAPIFCKIYNNNIFSLDFTRIVYITIRINPVLKIGNVKDVVLSYIPGVNKGNLEKIVDLCIFSNFPTTSYTITMDSWNADGDSFRVVSEKNDSIKYEIDWFLNSSATGIPVYNFSSGVKSVNLTSAKNSSTNCNEGVSNNASLKIKFMEKDLHKASAGKYADTLTIRVSPI